MIKKDDDFNCFKLAINLIKKLDQDKNSFVATTEEEMHKFIRTDGAWSIHKSVELNNKYPVSTHILHDSTVLVAFVEYFSFYNQELEHVTDIKLNDLVDGCLFWICSFSHMAHGDENEFGLLVRVDEGK